MGYNPETGQYDDYNPETGVSTSSATPGGAMATTSTARAAPGTIQTPYDYISAQSPGAQIGSAASAAGAPSGPDLMALRQQYGWTAVGNETAGGGAAQPLAAYEYGLNAEGLSGVQRGAALDAASKGTAQTRNPYDYVIGRDQNYVKNAAAEQQTLGQQTQQGYAALQGQAAAQGAAAQQGFGALQGQAGTQGMQAQLDLNSLGAKLGAQGSSAAGAMSGYGQGITSYGQGAASNVAAGAAALQGQAAGLGDQAGAMAGRNAYDLNFGQQNNSLARSNAYAQQLAGLQQGPSGAQAMLQSGANQSMAQSLALARSGRGFGGSAAGTAQALQQNAQTMQQVGNQSAMLGAQEAAQWNAQRAQNLGAASNIMQGAGSQYGQQQQVSAQSALTQQQQNDAAAAQLQSLSLQGQNSALGQQIAAGQLGVGAAQAGANTFAQGQQLEQQGLQSQGQMVGQGANVALQGTQLQGSLLGQGTQAGQQSTQAQGQMLGAGAAAASQGGMNAFGFNQAQNTTDVNHEAMITQDYGIRSGVALQNQQMQDQKDAALLGAIGTAGGALIGSFAGPAGTVGGAAAGGAAGSAIGQTSDRRAKKDVRELDDMGHAFDVLQRGPPALDQENPYRAPPRQLDQQNPYTDVRPAQGYSYEYKDPTEHGQGQFAGPMAQDLEKSPATSGAVYTDPNGVKKIDTSRLSLVNTSAISDQQRKLDELEAEIRSYDLEKSRTKRGRARQPASDPEDAPVSLKGYGFSPAEYFRSTPPAGREHTRVADAERLSAGRSARRFDSLDAIPYDAEAAPKDVSPRHSFARSMMASALDTAALPVKAAGAAAEALGYPNAAAHLSGQDATESLEWLGHGRDPAEIRHEERFNQAEAPAAAWAGDIAGSMIGGAAQGALTSRLNPAVGSVLGAIKRKTREPREMADPALAREVFGRDMKPADYSRLLGEHKRLGGALSSEGYPNAKAITVQLDDESPGSHYDSTLQRTFRRTPEGLEVTHDQFTLPKKLQERGIGADVLRKEAERYKELGVAKVSTKAEWSGRAVWPKMGYELKSPAEFADLKAGAERLARKPIQATNLRELANTPEGARYLGSKHAPDEIELVATPDSILAALQRNEPAKDRARARVAAADRGEDRVPAQKGAR